MIKIELIKIFVIGILLFISLLTGQVNTEAMRFAENINGIRNQFDLEFGYERANTEIFEMATKYRLDYIKRNNSHSFMIINFENGYEKEHNLSKNIITNKGFIHIRTTKNVFNNYQMEVFTQYEFNEFLLLNDRYLLGSGVRIGLKGSEYVQTYLGMGFMYEKEIYKLDLENEKSLFRSTNYIKNNVILSSNIELKNTAYFQIAVDDFIDYRMLYDGDLTFHTNDFFAFTISLKYRYDNDPQGNLDNSYFQISNGVSFNF